MFKTNLILSLKRVLFECLSVTREIGGGGGISKLSTVLHSLAIHTFLQRIESFSNK